MNITPATRYTLCALIYYSFMTLGHEYFSNALIVPLKNMVGAGITEHIFLGAVCLVGAIFLWHVGEGHLQGRALLYGLFLLCAAAACTQWLMVTRIEMVHFPQYAILGILLRKAGFSPGATYCLGQWGSVVDEGRQYLLHPRYTGYFDWNDLILNTIGLCMGLWLARTYAVTRTIPRSIQYIFWGVTGVFAMILFGGLASGFIQTHVPLMPGQTPTAFPLMPQGQQWGQVLALSLQHPVLWGQWHTGPFGMYYVLDSTLGLWLVPVMIVILYCVQQKIMGER